MYFGYHPTSNAPGLGSKNLVVRGVRAYPVTRRFLIILDVLRSSDPGTVGGHWGN